MHGRMPLPKEVNFVTFDVYGTLIDWETGAFDAFSKEAERDGYTLSREELIPLFLKTQQEIKGGSYELYAEVLRRTAVNISRELGWPLEPSRSGFLPDSVARWPPYKETNTQLERFAKKFQVGLISNIDDKLLGQTRRHFKVDFDLVVTAQQVRSYKPDPAHFKEAERVVPGHGEPIDGARAAAILREDRAYVEALIEQGEAAKLPLARRTGEQRKIHEANVARV